MRNTLDGLVIGPRYRKRPTPDFVDDTRRRERRFTGRREYERTELAHVGRDRDQVHEVARLPPAGCCEDIIHRKVGLMEPRAPLLVPYQKIGRASCKGRGCQLWSIWVVERPLKNKQK